MKLSEYIDEANREGIALVDIRSADIVTVYRVVSDTPIAEVDFAWNYTSSNSTYFEDYVARSVDETMNYYYGGRATLIRYEMPAVFVAAIAEIGQPGTFFDAVIYDAYDLAKNARNSIAVKMEKSPYLRWLPPDETERRITDSLKP